MFRGLEIIKAQHLEQRLTIILIQNTASFITNTSLLNDTSKIIDHINGFQQKEKNFAALYHLETFIKIC